MSSDSKQNIVIIGGGSGGNTLARSLSGSLDSSKFNLILISARPFTTFLPTTARMVVSGEDKLEETSLVPYDKLFINGNGTFKQGKVIAIHKTSPEAGSVELDSGEQIAYRYLVLATGAIWPAPLQFPDTREQVMEHLAKVREDISKAKDVVIIGGGSVGVELAGEIKELYPSKSVTVVHGGRALMNDVYPDKFRNNLANSLKALKTDIIFNDYIDSPARNGEITTRNGKKLKADLVISAVGPRPNTSFIKSLDEGLLTPQGFVIVEPTLQLPGHPSIFAIGDITNIVEQKQSAKAYAHANVVAKNIVALDSGKPLNEYKAGAELIIVTVGKTGGAGHLFGFSFGDFLSRHIKAKTLLVGMGRKAMGY